MKEAAALPGGFTRRRLLPHSKPVVAVSKLAKVLWLGEGATPGHSSYYTCESSLSAITSEEACSPFAAAAAFSSASLPS